MTDPISRRDFLKMAGILSGNVVLPSIQRAIPAIQSAGTEKKNILIVVFDAWSAYHLSLHGYPRETAPNITRLAERAIVYHNHFAAGNFTAPSTASLLTGVLPWTHRVFQMSRPVAKSVADKSIFDAFKDYYRIAYSHNPLANSLLNQFHDALDEYIPIESLYLTDDGLFQKLFRNDDDVSSLSWVRTIKKEVNAGYSYSLFLSNFYKPGRDGRISKVQESYPLGLPYVKYDNYFILEQAIDYLGGRLDQIPQPFLAYFHFLPPHQPYSPHRDFYNVFKDDLYQPIEKPADVFGGGFRRRPQFLARFRQFYDEYILSLDREFSRFFDHLEKSGILANTWVILTSDHGELFERAIWGHITPVLFQPIVRVPLMIFEPGRSNRVDIHTSTSAIDLLPTLLHLTGGQAADWTEGNILPPFEDASQVPDHGVYTIDAKNNDPSQPLSKATVMLVKGRYKLTYYFGYSDYLGSSNERLELYDLEADPEELTNLYQKQTKPGKNLLDELKSKLVEMDNPS